ncbi:MAG: flagellar biosynthetic protein FliR, partial [Planctomycetota bacterium]
MNGVTPLLEHVAPLFLVASRMLGLFMTAPMLNSLNLPRQVKVLLGVSLAVAAYPIAGPQAQIGAEQLDLFSLAPILFGEALIGSIIGLLASLPLILIQLAGYLAGYQMGL